MEKKLKIAIIIIIAICIIIPVSVVAYNNYQYNKEQADFNNTIKKVSDMENKTDIQAYDTFSKSSVTTAQSIAVHIEDNKTGTEEIAILQNLSNTMTNETLKNYTNLEIERLTSEHKIWVAEIEYCQAIDNYYNGNGSISQVTKKGNEIDTYANSTVNKKIEVEQYLARNPELKNRLTQMGIDEDFIIDQSEDYNYTLTHS